MSLIIKFLKERLSEPSTYATLAAVSGGLGVSLSADIWGYVFVGLTVVFGVLGVVMREKDKALGDAVEEALETVAISINSMGAVTAAIRAAQDEAEAKAKENESSGGSQEVPG